MFKRKIHEAFATRTSFASSKVIERSNAEDTWDEDEDVIKVCFLVALELGWIRRWFDVLRGAGCWG